MTPTQTPISNEIQNHARISQAAACLPSDVRKQAHADYLLFKKDPFHPSLQFKRIANKLYSVRIGVKYRALGLRVSDDLIIWGWIGTHGDYDKRV